MITEEKLAELRNSIANRPRSLRAKTVVIGLRQAFEMLDTLSALWRVAKGADSLCQRIEIYINDDTPKMFGTKEAIANLKASIATLRSEEKK